MNTKCGRGANAAGFHGASPLCAMSRGLGTRCDARSGQVCFCVALGFQKHQQMPFLVTLLLMHCCHCPHQSHPFLYMCKLVFQTGSRHSQLFPFPSLRFQVQEMDITLDILRIKKSIQGIGCLQSRWEELEGQAARLGLQRPWKQLELAHPGNWHFCPPHPLSGRQGLRSHPQICWLYKCTQLVIRKLPPPQIPKLPTNLLKTGYQILKHFCWKSQRLHDCACQKNKPKKQELRLHFISTLQISRK